MSSQLPSLHFQSKQSWVGSTGSTSLGIERFTRFHAVDIAIEHLLDPVLLHKHSAAPKLSIADHSPVHVATLRLSLPSNSLLTETTSSDSFLRSPIHQGPQQTGQTAWACMTRTHEVESLIVDILLRIIASFDVR